MWSALFRNWAMADWMKLAELAWKPWRFGKYKQDASDEDIDDLITALEGLTTNGVAVFSDRAEIEVEWPERGRGGKPEHRDLAEFLGMEMSKCVLGQTLTVESGERGARSLGEVHDRVRRDIRENDAISIAATIRRALIAPLVRLNFGADVMVPGFHFVTEDVVDLGSLARATQSFVAAGLEIPQSWVRDRAGIADPEPGEGLLLGQGSLFTPETTEPAPGDEDNEPKEDTDEDDDSGDE
jgi:phage gp29-like protein